MSALDKAILLAGYLTLYWAIPFAIGCAVAAKIDHPLPAQIGIVLGLLWAIVGLHEWAWEVTRWNS